MTDGEMIRELITGAPNFVGFIVLTIVLYRRLVASDRRQERLLEYLRECEREEEIRATIRGNPNSPQAQTLVLD
jgi:hypothetical protein